jgi:D-arginine utilization repressor
MAEMMPAARHGQTIHPGQSVQHGLILLIMVEVQNTVQRWAPACEAVARLLSPHAEVVLHDPGSDRVMAIWNPISGREPGDPCLLNELGDLDEMDTQVYGPYPKSLADGRHLSSVSAVLRDSAGHPEVVLCINVDRTAFQEAARLLASFAAPVKQQPQELFEHDWIEGVHDFVGDYVRQSGTQVNRLTRAERCALLAQMDAAGVFGRQRSIPVIARILQISRSSIYNLLAEVRKGESPTNANAS